MPVQPLISFVIPVYGVREYLLDCIASVLGPAANSDANADIEVIAVDDASPDGCGALLDELADADARLTVIHMDSNRGPGNARNVGLTRATGAYVWFVDGDDLIPAGGLATVRSRLEQDQPDVLLIDYEDLLPDGSTRAGPGSSILRAAPSGCFELADVPQVINLTMTAWSKLFQREFLIGLGTPFRPGIHEDIPVTCAALLGGKLAALARVCYSYRRSRRGSFMATTSTNHLAVFDAYEEVLGALGKRVAAGDHAATPAVQSVLFERAIWHYTTVLQSGGLGVGPIGRSGLVPRRERQRYFERMHADFLRYVPAGYKLPPGARGAKLSLIKRDAYVTYEVLEPVNRLRVAIRRAIGRGSAQRAG